MSEPSALPSSHIVLETTSTHTTSGFLSFSPTPAEEELMMFFIGLRFFDEPMFQQSIQLDLSRATAILYRQSRRGSDKVHIESRMLQESLKPFVVAARGEDSEENIHVFDEGAGVSGTKGIDKRKKLQELHIEIASNLIGDIVLARPDRLFRDKHFANVSTFTQLAEKMKIKVIVPTDKGVIVYDFTKEKDLQAFQEAMIQAYAYIVNQIGYMNRARAFKVSKGLYGGGTMPLPYVLRAGELPATLRISSTFFSSCPLKI